jgi:hypothetical protein
MTDCYVPRWFKRLLAIVDPTYYVRRPRPDGPYEIMKDAEIYLKFKDGTEICRREPRVVDTTPYLGDRIIQKLQYRKWLGRQMRILDKPNAEREAWQRHDADKKAKMKEEGFEQAAYGLKDGYEVDKRHTVS